MKLFPDWLRKELPYFYICIGLLTMITVREGLAVLSALTLIAAGCVEWLLRHRPVAEPEAREKHGERHVQHNQFVQISWNKSFECGNPVIDAQHRLIFGIGNELINAVLTWKPKFDVEYLFDELVNHIAAHFRTEEAILAQNGHPITNEHHELHRDLLVKAADLRNRYHSDQIIISNLVGFITYDIIAKHIIEDDLKYVVRK